ncbi:MAG: imidazole glycerol phosphate synthase subunit HisF [Candidatus Micrarchaeota archaeon]
MWCKRIIPCLDVLGNKVVKGTNFVSLRDAGDPIQLAKKYYQEGADELIFLDISASLEGRTTMVDVTKKVAKEIFIPFTIGGGINSLDDINTLLRAGADKVSLNSAAITDQKLIEKAADEFGSQAIVVAIDAKWDNGKFEVYSKSGTTPTKIDAIQWAKTTTKLGAGELLVTSIDNDGTKTGFNIELTSAISQSVKVPVIASGGAGSAEDFLDVFQKTKASAALAASIFHYGTVPIPELKKYLQNNGVDMRV